MAVQVMTELGIDISSNQSKSTDEFRDIDFDRVITVCDHAAQNCPAWLGRGIVTHIGFPDPAEAGGTDEERLTIFRQVRDGLREKVMAYLHNDVDSFTVSFNTTGSLSD
jgi:arsenate reductase